MRLIALCLLSLAVAFPVRAEKVTDFTLDNGMQVVVIEDARAPVVVHMVWYRVGAADEAPGKSGIAHFLEHLMFKGTDTVPSGAFSQTVSDLGGMDNAFTSWDYTAYFQRVASEHLPLMMQMESDRMTNLRLTEEDVVTERAVVLEERTSRTDSDPGALFSEQRQAAQYLNHPYGRPIIGWRHEIEQLNRTDALAFYKLHYAPNNAILVVAGDVTPDRVRALAEDTYGKIPENPAVVPRVRPSEPPQISERRLTYGDPRVGQPYVVRSYLAPTRKPGDQSRAAALSVLAELLGGSGSNSVLGRALQFDRQIAVHTAVWYQANALDQGSFDLVVVPSEGVSLDQAEAELDVVLDRFLTEGVDQADFDRIMTMLRASEIYAQDSTQSVGRRFGESLTTGLTITDQRDWANVLQSVTPDAVMEAARDVLVRGRAVTGHLEKEIAQ
ncbi:MAG: pitrilysin family protein [Gemmobacter sp.]|nr:pitrilysin family protein [Gemmobacter sp.]